MVEPDGGHRALLHNFFDAGLPDPLGIHGEDFADRRLLAGG